MAFKDPSITKTERDALTSVVNLPDYSVPKGLSGKLVESGTVVDEVTEQHNFSKSIIIPVDSLIFSTAWKMSSAGASVVFNNLTDNEFFRIHTDSITEVKTPEIIVNRIATGPFVLQPIDDDTLIDPLNTPVVVPALGPILGIGPAEDGQSVIFADLKLTPESAKTNITITIKLNGEIFTTSFYENAILIEAPNIYRFVYNTPWDVKVGDTLELTTLSADGPMIFLGRADTQQKWQRGSVVLWDKKQVLGLLQSDFQELTVDTSTTSVNFVTLLTSNISTGANKVIVQSSASLSKTGVNFANFRISIDGIPIRSGSVELLSQPNSISLQVSKVLTEDDHVITLEWKVPNGTASIRPVTAPDSESCSMYVQEVLV